ncbi:MAG TPA: cobyrinic acid a,c-diamide synthase [Oscillatoriales cyanobacterium M59_W2019_021]|nr:MAG: cobyrinic acid a,c-diamide synthase [Cyanobacteria bacterium J055]HIK31644.1 cobyrinic acid a,c-diamide synthase [Oscillatoriales cyanobacterium M4454_W2019_049]HIK50343.1 cobyrinic acid a,c-diamide synthase [Oscillatoriales cyanobacterium M59_W2019_021]
MLPPDFSDAVSIFEKLPQEARQWAEGLHWNERRYVLSLCHILCAATSEQQAEFLDEYTADGLVYRLLEDYDSKEKVKRHLKRFRIKTKLTESLLRRYIRQFYIHCAQDLHRKPDCYLETAVRLMGSTEESNNAFNYTLGFELLKMIFQMSWLQHEKLYLMQKNQQDFIIKYIKPIQQTHKLNGLIVPKDKTKFFAKRDYYVRVPELTTKKLVELTIATFPAKVVTDFGFEIIRHPNSLQFDYDYIFARETDEIFRV